MSQEVVERFPRKQNPRNSFVCKDNLSFQLKDSTHSHILELIKPFESI